MLRLQSFVHGNPACDSVSSQQLSQHALLRLQPFVHAPAQGSVSSQLLALPVRVPTPALLPHHTYAATCAALLCPRLLWLMRPIVVAAAAAAAGTAPAGKAAAAVPVQLSVHWAGTMYVVGGRAPATVASVAGAEPGPQPLLWPFASPTRPVASASERWFCPFLSWLVHGPLLPACVPL